MLAEDHELLRAGLRGLVTACSEFEVVAETGDGREAVRLALEHGPQVIVMDVSLPGMSGIDATRRILEAGCPSRVLIASQHQSFSVADQALRAGASGYLLKTSSASDLITAIRSVRDGKAFLSPGIAAGLVSSFARGGGIESPLDSLTAREREVLALIGQSLSGREIAARLGCSVRTVEAHRANLMSKLDIHKVSGLVRFAIREGLVAA